MKFPTEAQLLALRQVLANGRMYRSGTRPKARRDVWNRCHEHGWLTRSIIGGESWLSSKGIKVLSEMGYL